jgi:ABC-type antimicrobial peptide transport system permease subunit
MAIGATGADVRRMVVGEVGVMLAIGAGLGLAGAFAGSQVVGSLLFGMSEKDPAVFAGAAALLIVVAGVAAYVPTLRATRVNPIQALRYE